MTEKRFTDVNVSYEESWIRLKDNGLFLIFPIHYTDKEEYGLPTLEDLLNELNDENKQLKQLNIPVNEIKDIVVDCRGRIIGVYYND